MDLHDHVKRSERARGIMSALALFAVFLAVSFIDGDAADLAASGRAQASSPPYPYINDDLSPCAPESEPCAPRDAPQDRVVTPYDPQPPPLLAPKDALDPHPPVAPHNSVPEKYEDYIKEVDQRAQERGISGTNGTNQQPPTIEKPLPTSSSPTDIAPSVSTTPPLPMAVTETSPAPTATATATPSQPPATITMPSTMSSLGAETKATTPKKRIDSCEQSKQAADHHFPAE
ncbi:unnamed protein product [Vitrella brassicaformis CCMP3155]|uniref:Uncharacterized protein n=1 Tax=Vitrella brassicaformis (strain CCMP3155) TaxID=1169540 RepID=A0A0G4EBI7_VITBC|nr:unnamed protein product [Vitrella brassicaformis CCMP3155]|eukprot:CEL92658.1 unnamed protein product [Vitrella brassicaformis CCMP3155]